MGSDKLVLSRVVTLRDAWSNNKGEKGKGIRIRIRKNNRKFPSHLLKICEESISAWEIVSAEKHPNADSLYIGN